MTNDIQRAAADEHLLSTGSVQAALNRNLTCLPSSKHQLQGEEIAQLKLKAQITELMVYFTFLSS